MATVTSHRAFFRQHLTHWHTESSYHNLVHTSPCKEGARYRRYAFLPTDKSRFMKIETSSIDPSMVILSVGGMTRTVMQGPAQCGGISPDLDLSDGEYEIGTQEDLEGVHTEVRIKPCSTCNWCDLWVNGVYGNPSVQFDAKHPPDNTPLDLGTDFRFVLNDRFPYSDFDHNMLELSSTIAVDGCPDIVPGAPETSFIGKTVNEVSGKVEYWLHSTSLMVQNNTLQEPMLDGGKGAMNATANAPLERQRAVCLNAPRTFLNEDYCVLSHDACFQNEGPDVDIDLNVSNLELMHYATGKERGTETKYGKYLRLASLGISKPKECLKSSASSLRCSRFEK
jgi:hypothetical protein